MNTNNSKTRSLQIWKGIGYKTGDLQMNTDTETTMYHTDVAVSYRSGCINDYRSNGCKIHLFAGKWMVVAVVVLGQYIVLCC